MQSVSPLRTFEQVSKRRSLVWRTSAWMYRHMGVDLWQFLGLFVYLLAMYLLLGIIASGLAPTEVLGQ